MGESKRTSRALAGTATLALTLLLAALPAAAETHGARMAIVGTVVALNEKSGIALVRHDPLETSPAGTVECRVRVPGQLHKLRVGMTIRAIADTAKQPWTLWDVRILPKSKPPAAG